MFGHRYNPDPDSDPHAVHYREEHTMMARSLLSTVLSWLTLVISIIVLYLVQSTPKRLGLTTIFTATFSFALAIITTAKRSENFVAIAAFAAVQAVPIGTNGPSAFGSSG